jgi:hypothetical protein
MHMISHDLTLVTSKFDIVDCQGLLAEKPPKPPRGGGPPSQEKKKKLAGSTELTSRDLCSDEIFLPVAWRTYNNSLVMAGPRLL